MSRYVTLPYAVYVYARHLAVSVHNFAVSATQMCQFPNRVLKGRGSEYFSFFPVDLPQVPSALLLTITRTSNAVEGLAAACN